MSLTLIQTVTLPSNTNTLSFNSIPSTYKDLYLLLNVRSTDSGSRVPLIMTFNGVTSSTYSAARGYASEGGLGADSGTSYSYVPLSSINGAGVGNSNVFSPCEAYIFDYSGGAYTTGKLLGMQSNASSSSFVSISGHFGWNNTAVVSSIQISPISGSGDLVAGSNASLYGIK
jgi:hypothetical protein